MTLSAGLTVLSIASFSQKQETNKQPNIIYIMADDMGYANLGCYGSKRILTPNIDRLAREGVRYTSFYAGTTVSAPSRCSLMTGLHTGHCQVRGNLQWKPYGQVPLEAGTVTFPLLLQKAGYKTALIGKWGLGVEGTTGDPNKQGFDYSYGYLCQVLAHNHCPEYLMENGKKVYLRNKVKWTDSTVWNGLGSYPLEKIDFSQELFTKKAIEFITINKSKPFLLYLSSVIPHEDGEAPKGKMYSDIPSFEPYNDKPWTESEKGFAAMITYLDTEVGKLMAKLKELGLEENTLVIFTSDNGGDSPDSFHNESNMPFRGSKRDMYEGGIRIPFIARWKGMITPGMESDHAGAFWDVLPTVCDLAGIKTPAGIDGISFLPSLLGKEQQKHDYLYFEFHEKGGKQAVIKGDWKCIRLNVDTPAKMVTELYNLREDLKEQNDIASKQPEKVKELVNLMKESRTESKYFEFKKIAVK